MDRFRAQVRLQIVKAQLLLDAKFVMHSLFRRPPAEGWRRDR
jgi:hypothetical protein